MTNNTLSRIGLLLLALLIAIGFATAQVVPGPGFLSKPGTASFSPLSLSPAVWFDANDASTVTLVSSAISQVNDKSGNSRHATQATSAERPTYPSAILNAKPVFRFGSGQWLYTAATLLGGTDVTIFLVTANPASSQANLSDILDYEHSASSGQLSNWVIQQDGTTNNTNYFAYNYTGTSFVTTSNFSTSGSRVQAIRKNGSSVVVSQNGTQTTQTLQSGLNSQTRQIGIARNVNATLGRQWLGDIGEIIIFSSALSDTNLQKIEGYLAWKWGLQSSLPVGHPYKSAAP